MSVLHHERAAVDVFAAARMLTPRIVAARDEIERLRHVPAEIATALARAGLYQMYLPRSLGGAELTPGTAFEAIEELSKADGSVGWCVLNANLFALMAGYLAPEAARRIVGDPPDLRMAGSLRPQGRAWAIDGGYRVTGRWNFASGVHNANWLYCTSLIMDGEKPRMTQAGSPALRVMWAPAKSANILDTWSVVGLRGSGSHDFVLDDLFIPESDTCFFADKPYEAGVLYRSRNLLTAMSAGFAANALGIARGAIDALLAMASQVASTQSEVLLRDRPAVQASVAEADAIVGAARSYMLESLTRAWTALSLDAADPATEIARARLAVPHAMRESVRAVDLVFHAAGTHAIHRANPIERHFRDIHVAVQHVVAATVHYESAGKVLMGLRPSEPGW